MNPTFNYMMSLGCFPLTLVLFLSCSLFIVIHLFFWNNSSLSKDVTLVTTLQFTSSSCQHRSRGLLPRLKNSKCLLRQHQNKYPVKVFKRLTSASFSGPVLQDCVWNTVQPERAWERQGFTSKCFSLSFCFSEELCEVY